MLVAAHPGQPIDVLGRLVLDDVDDIINGDDADQLVLFVDDRDRQQIITGDALGDLFLVGIHLCADQIGRHDPLQRGFRRHQQQPPQ